MKMTFRWYGSQMDPIPLRYIKQIPNMSGVVSSLMDMPAGALWPTERIRALKQEVNDAGLELEVIESVNIHEDIKLGLPSRDEYIDNYRQTVARLGQAGVKVICYNFMPVSTGPARIWPSPGSTVLPFWPMTSPLSTASLIRRPLPTASNRVPVTSRWRAGSRSAWRS